MAVIRPFRALRPDAKFVSQVASLPYDVVTLEEAKRAVKKNNLSFLHIDKPEVNFEGDTNFNDDKIYKKAQEKLSSMIDARVYMQEKIPCLYIYQLKRGNRAQKGIVACTSIDDYLNNVIKKHENTLEMKERDRINHVKYLQAHTGPILMSYRENKEISRIIDDWILKHDPVYDFISCDGVYQTVWVIDDEIKIGSIVNLFSQVESLYIADGHHRAAAAVKVGLEERKKQVNYDGSEGFNYFLSVIFPDSQLTILEYNRIVKDLNGLSESEFINRIKENFEQIYEGKEVFKPNKRHLFGMYLGGKWYGFRVKQVKYDESDVVSSLDVSILHDLIIEPILGIKDIRTDDRIDFIGGSNGIEELVKRVDSGEMKVAFTLFPTSMGELMKIADSGSIMPPKSTWFDPKLQSGIFIHLMTD